MAVYTQLSDTFVKAMVAVYPGVNGPPPGREVTSIEGIAQGSINTTYRVRLDDNSVWYLRVNEGKPFARLLHERDVLAALSRHALGITTPLMEQSVARSCFFAVDDDTGPRRWACLFRGLPGRELGVFEVTPHHSEQVGRALAKAHRVLRQHRGGANPYRAAVVTRWLDALSAHPATMAQAQPLRATLSEVLRQRRLLPRGLIHGDVFVDNTRFERSALVSIFDWEMAGRDHLALDVAITICAWAFHRKDGVMTLRDDVAAAFVEGYQRVRPLTATERRGLFTELRLAAIRFAASRLRDFGLPRDDAPERRVLDPIDFIDRLHVIEGAGEQAIRKAVGL